MDHEVVRNASRLNARTVLDMRLSVGWTGTLENCAKELQTTYSNFSVWEAGICVGYVNTISDGFSDALINNLIVRPTHQGQGIASALLSRLVSELRDDGVRYFNVVFEDNLRELYRKNGFTVMSGGVIDFWKSNRAD